jgi:hypothetical protein
MGCPLIAQIGAYSTDEKQLRLTNWLKLKTNLPNIAAFNQGD